MAVFAGLRVAVSGGIIVAALNALPSLADGVSLLPIADTSLMEVAPDNNAGARTWVNGGSTMHALRNRALFKFDIAGNIPAGARITGATLSLAVTGIPSDGYDVGYFDLHRLLRDWGEGSEIGTGRGGFATTNEATWNSPLALTTNLWGTPGGAASIDYDPVVTASQIVYDDTAAHSPYSFPDDSADHTQIIADIQNWLDHPSANFGWMLICEDESATSTARRFGSREDPLNPPMLNISYIPPITSVGLVSNLFHLSFAAQAGQGYAIDFSTSLATNATWLTLTNIPPPDDTTNFIITDSITGTARFYRLRTQ